MIETYAGVLVVCVAALAIGQAAIALCGCREWSWLSPSVGLALLCALCWATVRLPGKGVTSAIAVLLVTIAAGVFIWRVRRPPDGDSAGEEATGTFGVALRVGWPVVSLALAAVSIPFVVAGHFGILGTGFNPDMSQHLLATHRLSDGTGFQLLHQGYPLGPHAVVVTLHEGLGVGLVQGFDGLTMAVAVLASLTALTVFAGLPALQRIPSALLVGIPYMVASYYAQGSLKETMQALFVLAFVLALREATRNPAWRELPLRFVPAALVAVGGIYTYSFPTLIWLAPIAVVWAIAERLTTRSYRPADDGDRIDRRPRFSAPDIESGGSRTNTSPAGPPGSMSGPAASPAGPPDSVSAAAWRPVFLALLVFMVLAAPELGRMLDFKRFETFDPNGLGLGNLFEPISPFEALGIWPSGDFRLSPGDGAVPPFGYFLGAAFAAVLLVYGAILCWRRRETAVLAGLAGVALACLAAHLAGTPYTVAKAIEIAAPLAALVILLPLLRRPVGVIYLLFAGACSLLVLANAPVGPTSYSSALNELRPAIGQAPTVVLASRRLLDEEHGQPYLVWELRGGRICVEYEEKAGGEVPPGTRFVIASEEASRPPFDGFRLRRRSGPYMLWEQSGSVRGRSDCPLIAVRQARRGG